MKELESFDISQMQEYISELEGRYKQFKDLGLKLDMSRGKPCPEQLDLSAGILDFPLSTDTCKASDGTDCRNYGGIDGLPEMKAIFAEMLEVSTKEVIIGGNSSLNMMHDAVARAMLLGVCGGKTPWSKLPKVKFLCPVPGYDRHFGICQLMNIEMINVDMTEDGPDMDAVEELVSKDKAIKGIWCVPKYSNPDGITFCDEVVDRLAKMETKADDFRIFWDNAYIVHHLEDEGDKLKNLLEACKEAGNPDRAFIFASTSKISFPGAGVAAMAASEDNINFIRKQLSKQTIGPDKINQLRHTAYFKSLDDIKQHMKKHSAIIKPKFDAVLDILEKELGGRDIAWWNKPRGGYFISLNTLDGCAGEVYDMAGKAGVTLTNVGDTFPYGKDPRDRNIRIAPTYPSLEDLKSAIEILCICIKLVSAKRKLQAAGAQGIEIA
ncbi:DNA-binding transcriptional MocR family regulator [Anaerobacterium chartisolvens]|uniref:DNA-binding transcriptional MocR family regulator n=1 Tax=Anaerobacterium chartisolvens TaxID=1297424 RepID=A0A369BHK6_9FIRM|nr:aminotransferase class I/II-fold pyridoxal phosphate-dependent enzyme [Anaerobacterium chartisolvens]RCX20058.1 DNA-binding transcriptional MocR family regulator [Anaerobacterium chartisolvens]